MKETLDKIHQFMAERNWTQLKPSDMCKSISIEANELLEIFQWVNLTVEETVADSYRMGKVRKEIADVLIYTLALAMELGLDPEELISTKLDLNAQKYPADVIRDRDNKQSHNDAYLRIKEEYRGRNET